ncbi:restriction endonuclease [Streptomyces sp. NPDC056401]|uniref:restriction endonuclease n=1 Tax=Streptomyces sp. NPDC056401 TaxID=3345809 RepID=UPI0035DC3988
MAVAGGSDQYAREQARQAKEHERQKKAAEAEAKRKAREEKVAYEAARAQEAVDKTSVAEHDVEQLVGLLRAAVLDGRPLSFDSLRQHFVPAAFGPSKSRAKPVPLPRWGEYEPEPPRGWLGALGFGRRSYDAEVEAARKRFDEALRDHAREEHKRVGKLDAAQARHDERNQQEAARIEEWNAGIEARRAAYQERDVEAVEWFIDQVLAASAYPHGFPKAHQVSFQADTGDLLVEIDLPLEDVVPVARAYRYVKTRDEITPVPRPEKERHELYASVLAQTALRTVHELFAADTDGVVRSVALNGHVATIDRATGREVHPCLITLQAGREEFGELVLTQVDPQACLKRLRSLISPNPYELEPVRPLVTFDLSKYRLMDSMDVVAGLDSRPVLMDLSPTEFEHLVRQLFEAIGLDSVNTRPSQDEGVDAVAMNTDPVMRGLCIIQAKRTAKVVPFESVSALAGVVEHKRAAKGILVTTSWFGRASEAFANDHGRLELLDGANLVHLFKEHLDLDVIPGPVPPKRRPR